MSAEKSSAPPGKAKPWRNWSGAVRFQPRQLLRPRSLPQLQATVRAASAAGESIRVAGSGHSFVPLVQTDGTLLSLCNLTGLESVENGRARLWAGTQLKPLGEELALRGWGMLNLGDINKQALAGAVATGTHGTGLRLGSISTQVQAMTLVTADGEAVECSATQEPELFAASRVALGALGVMARFDIEVAPAYKLKLVKQAMDLDECLAAAPTLAAQHRHFEFYWVPYTRRTLVKLMDPTDEPESSRSLTAALEMVLENGALSAISRYARMRPSAVPAMARLIASTLKHDTTTMVANCHRAFSSVRLVHFQEMEYELPAERGPEALRELAEFIEKKKVPVHFPVEYRYVKGDDIWLSPFYGRDTASISVHQYVGMPHEAYFRGAEAIFLNHGGRPHWGKMHYLGAAELSRRYPRWDDFAALRRRMDPKGVFLNPLLRHMLGA